MEKKEIYEIINVIKFCCEDISNYIRHQINENIDITFIEVKPMEETEFSRYSQFVPLDKTYNLGLCDKKNFIGFISAKPINYKINDINYSGNYIDFLCLNPKFRNSDKALSFGISPDQLIWDPGLGFSKTTDQNIQIIAIRTNSKLNFIVSNCVS